MTAPPPPDREWRVTWARTSWARGRDGRGDRTASRRFTHRAHALALADKLRRPDRPDLAPLRLLRLDSRPVGSWAEETLPLDEPPPAA